jgi:hypothetical protein
MEILLADFSAKVGIENIFKPRFENENLHQDSNDNDVRIVNFATAKILVVKSTMFRTETLISTPGPPIMERLTTRLITC